MEDFLVNGMVSHEMWRTAALDLRFLYAIVLQYILTKTSEYTRAIMSRVTEWVDGTLFVTCVLPSEEIRSVYYHLRIPYAHGD